MPTTSKTKNPLAVAWGAAIKHNRQHVLRWSQGQLADHLGITRQAISQWESGTTMPSGEYQQKLVAVLGIDPKTLHDIFSRAT